MLKPSARSCSDCTQRLRTAVAYISPCGEAGTDVRTQYRTSLHVDHFATAPPTPIVQQVIRQNTCCIRKHDVLNSPCHLDEMKRQLYSVKENTHLTGSSSIPVFEPYNVRSYYMKKRRSRIAFIVFLSFCLRMRPATYYINLQCPSTFVKNKKK